MTAAVTVLSTAKPKLGRLLARPGGISVTEAIARAEAGLAEMAAACREALDAALLRAETVGRDLLRATQDPDALDGLYLIAEEIAGLAGPAHREEVGAAAYSLCDLIDRFKTGAPVRPAAIRVHLDALTLLRRPPAETGGADGRRAVLDGLSRMVRSV